MVDMDWALEQLKSADYNNQDAHRQSVRTATLTLLKTLSQQNHNEDTLDETLNLFNKLARGYDLVTAKATKEAVWGEFRLGDVKPGQTTVRVKENAYSIRGEHHNGRIGTFGGARNGYAIVYYASGNSEGAGVHHAPDKLEVLISG